MDAQPFSVDTRKAGLNSMYENELIINFRTFENGIFFFSLADQGDMLMIQLTGKLIKFKIFAFRRKN